MIMAKAIQHIKDSHPWIDRICMFLDNATSTNKNRYLFSWGMHMVEQHNVQFMRFSFMLAGHTKFAPDRLFSQIATSYNNSDIFTIEELLNLCQKYATTFIEDGTNVCAWRDILGTKYSNLPGVRSFHDFLILRPNPDQDVIMKVRAHCFDAKEHPKVSPLRAVMANALPSPTFYKPGRVRPITGDKLSHMMQMYNTFIPLDRRPTFLPSFSSTLPLASGTSQTSAETSQDGVPSQALFGTSQACIGTSQACIGTSQALTGTSEALIGTSQAHTGTSQVLTGTSDSEALTGTSQALNDITQVPGTLSLSTATHVHLPKKTRKKSTCSVAGCDGTGHKNPAKWNQGHSTKSGCPRKNFGNS